MFKKQFKTKLSLVTLLLLTSNLYAVGENDFHYEEHEHTSIPEETTDITHTIIQNVSTNKIKRTKTGSKSETESKSNFSSLIIMDSEKSSITSGSTEKTSSAFKLNYDREFDNNSDIGAIFSYRNTEIDNTSINSKSILLAPYYKYYKDINDNMDIEAIINLMIGKEDVSGGTDYNKYGGGVTFVPTYYLNEKLLFNLPFGIQSIKRDGSLDDDLQNLLNYGLGTEYKIQPNWSVNLNVLQTKDLDSNSDLKATYYVLQSTYYGEYWNFGLGYKTVKDISNYDEDTYMLTVQYNW